MVIKFNSSVELAFLMYLLLAKYDFANSTSGVVVPESPSNGYGVSECYLV